jgi:hypothetical protein
MDGALAGDDWGWSCFWQVCPQRQRQVPNWRAAVLELELQLAGPLRLGIAGPTEAPLPGAQDSTAGACCRARLVWEDCLLFSCAVTAMMHSIPSAPSSSSSSSTLRHIARFPPPAEPSRADYSLAISDIENPSCFPPAIVCILMPPKHASQCVNMDSEQVRTVPVRLQTSL